MQTTVLSMHKMKRRYKLDLYIYIYTQLSLQVIFMQASSRLLVKSCTRNEHMMMTDYQLAPVNPIQLIS